MKRILVASLLVLALGSGCTNMSRTQQGVVSGAGLGAAAVLGIAAISGGALGWGAVAGAGLGAVAGAVVGKESQRDW